jgi:regulatory protein
MAQDPLQKARETSFNYLSSRARSVHEVVQKLRQKEFAEEIIEQVIADLQRLNFVDDRAFCRRWIEARLERATGARKLAQDLRRKGVAADIIDEVLAEYAGQLDAPGRAVGLLRKQSWRYRSLDREKARRRMLGFLARRGYDAQTAWEAIDQVWKELQEDEVTGN